MLQINSSVRILNKPCFFQCITMPTTSPSVVCHNKIIYFFAEGGGGEHVWMKQQYTAWVTEHCIRAVATASGIARISYPPWNLTRTLLLITVTQLHFLLRPLYKSTRAWLYDLHTLYHRNDPRFVFLDHYKKMNGGLNDSRPNCPKKLFFFGTSSHLRDRVWEVLFFFKINPIKLWKILGTRNEPFITITGVLHVRYKYQNITPPRNLIACRSWLPQGNTGLGNPHEQNLWDKF